VGFRETSARWPETSGVFPRYLGAFPQYLGSIARYPCRLCRTPSLDPALPRPGERRPPQGSLTPAREDGDSWPGRGRSPVGSAPTGPRYGRKTGTSTGYRASVGGKGWHLSGQTHPRSPPVAARFRPDGPRLSPMPASILTDACLHGRRPGRDHAVIRRSSPGAVPRSSGESTAVARGASTVSPEARRGR
jgi:hypothetical protein